MTCLFLEPASPGTSKTQRGGGASFPLPLHVLDVPGEARPTWLLLTFLSHQVFFLHGKSQNKEALLRTFKTLTPGSGKQYVFIASPALVTGVSQDTGVFTEVLEVISSWSTSAPDSEQRVVRPRYKRSRMT